MLVKSIQNKEKPETYKRIPQNAAPEPKPLKLHRVHASTSQTNKTHMDLTDGSPKLSDRKSRNDANSSIPVVRLIKLKELINGVWTQ